MWAQPRNGSTKDLSTATSVTPVTAVSFSAKNSQNEGKYPTSSRSSLSEGEFNELCQDLETHLFPRIGCCRAIRYIGGRPRTWITLLLILASAAVGTWRSALQDQREREETRRAVTTNAEDLAYSLNRQLLTSASSVYTLASMVEADGGAWLVQHFDGIAKTILTKYRGISNMDIAPFAVVLSKVPLAGNEGAIGHATLSDYRRVDATLATIRGRKILLEGPLVLLQGGIAVIGRYPVFSSFAPRRIPDVRSWWPKGNWSHPCCNTSMPLPGAEELPGPLDAKGNQTYFWGLVDFVSFVDKMMEDLQLAKAAETLSFQFRNRNKHPSMASSVFAHSPDAPPTTSLVNPVVIPISPENLGLDWELLVAPKGGWPIASSLFVVAMISIFGGLVISMVTIFLMESKSLQIHLAKTTVLLRAKAVKAALMGNERAMP